MQTMDQGYWRGFGKFGLSKLDFPKVQICSLLTTLLEEQ